jgi:transcriptional regulator with XRE-family HTH domain
LAGIIIQEHHMASRGERLHAALVARGIRKQMALAAELGVGESAISRWQRDESLSLSNAARICEALDISLDWFVLGRGDMNLHKQLEPEARNGDASATTPSLPASVRNAIDNLANVIGQELISMSEPLQALSKLSRAQLKS